MDKDLKNLQKDFDQRVAIGQWEIVHVDFPATADTDVEISHHLQPPDPEYIDVEVLHASGPPMVYRDLSPSRRAWGNGYIILRSGVPSQKADLLLTVPTLRRDLRQQYEGGGKTLGRPILPSEIAYEDEANVFTATQRISGVEPQLQFSETDRGTDLKNWDLEAQTEIFKLRKLNDSFASPTELLTVDRAGLITTLGQIKFPGTQNPSSDANTLDDYEEGPWTPTFGGSGGQSGQAYTANAGLYIKKGREVTATATIILSTLGTITGNVEVQGLPFPVDGLEHSCLIGFWAGFTTALVYLSGLATNGGSVITLYAAGGAVTALTTLAQANLSDTTQIRLTIVYRTTN